MYCIISCDFNLYTVWNVLAKNRLFKLCGHFFQKKEINEKTNKQTKTNRFINKHKENEKSFPMCIDHIDSFGNFLKFFVQKHFCTLFKKRGGAEHCFCHFLKNTVPCEFLLLKLYKFLYTLPY